MKKEKEENVTQVNKPCKHSVFVLDIDGNPLTPTTPCKARKLLKGNQAKKVWSKFNTFGIRMLVPTRNYTPPTTLGYDPGTKFEGFSVVTGNENSLSVKLDLPNKQNIKDKMEERSNLRRSRRNRTLRRRKARFNNRSRKGFIAPSQMVLICSRIKILDELYKMYPIKKVAIEDVKFDHYKHRWGKNFSTIEVGKNKIRNFFKDKEIEIIEYRGWETKELREKYEYTKTYEKEKNVFSSHCSDSLVLAIDINQRKHIEEGLFLVVDDTYRCYRRKLHYMLFSEGGIRKNYSKGNVKGIKKGRLICAKNNKLGYLCGDYGSGYRYYDLAGKRQNTPNILWISNKFKLS